MKLGGRKVGEKDYRGKGRVRTVNNMPSETVQSDAHLADINTIMGDFREGGMDILDEADLKFFDVSEFTDLADALNQARAAELDFLKLPSKVREIFDHDVAVWLDTAHDKDKRDALVEAGFLKAKDSVEVVPEKTPTAVGGGEKGSGTGVSGTEEPGGEKEVT